MTQITGPHSLKDWGGAQVCIYNRLPGDSDVARLETSLENCELEFSQSFSFNSVVFHGFKGVQISIHESHSHPLYSSVYFIEVMYSQRKDRS